MQKPELKLSVFSDYICPFCYIGHHRIQQLRKDYELKINWCFVELHPDTPSTGMSTSDLSYNDDQWQGIVNALNNLVEQEQLPFKHEHKFTTNSHHALLLAEATKPLGAEIFYKLHNRLFEAFFVDMINIGDKKQLKKIASECDLPAELTERALSGDRELEDHLKLYLQYAGQMQITGVPTTIIGQQKISGVPAVNSLQLAAREVSGHAVS